MSPKYSIDNIITSYSKIIILYINIIISYTYNTFEVYLFYIFMISWFKNLIFYVRIWHPIGKIPFKDYFDNIMTSCGGSFENPFSSSTLYVYNDNVDSHVGMKFNSITNMYNFYNVYVRRINLESQSYAVGLIKKIMLQIFNMLEGKKI